MMYNKFEVQENIQQQLYNLAINDTDEIRAIARHNREMEKNAQKSHLRIQEAEYKHTLKQNISDVSVQDYSVVKQVFDGKGNLCKQLTLFDCRVDKVKCYQYEGSYTRYFSLVLQAKDVEGYKIIESPLYDEKILSSKSKLKMTILGLFCVNDSKLQADAWSWMQNLLVQMLNYAQVTEIPFYPGWWNQNGKWRFVMVEDEENLFPSEIIRQFHMERITGLTVKEIVEELSVEIKEIHQSYVGALLIYRVNALMVRLLGELSFSSGIALIGEKAEAVAKTFLRTMQNEVDVINLDADAMRMIQKRIKMLQDTPVIFKISNPDSRTVQYKLEKIMSCMQTGYMEGIKVSRIFVFCLERFSSYFPLEDLIVLDTDRLKIEETRYCYAKFQNYVIQEIENSGEYWVKEMKRLYEGNIKDDTDKRISLAQTIVSILSKMLNLDEMREQPYEGLKSVLVYGKDEMERQLTSREGILLETFRERVIDLVDVGKICVVDRNKIPVGEGCEMIYHDREYYYFTKKTVNLICSLSNMDFRSLLSLKKQLAEQEALKQYVQTTNRRREYETDFRVRNTDGKCNDLSGLAIKREFFDGIGGIGLYELG